MKYRVFPMLCVLISLTMPISAATSAVRHQGEVLLRSFIIPFPRHVGDPNGAFHTRTLLPCSSEGVRVGDWL